MSPNHVAVTIQYAKPGTQPPIFVAGSFSDPAWQPQEMEYTVDADGEHTYTKEVHIEAAKEYQYKFRMGGGDWWVLNEDSPTVTDDLGNRNNLLIAPIPLESPSKEEPHDPLDTPRILSSPTDSPLTPAADMAKKNNKSSRKGSSAKAASQTSKNAAASPSAAPSIEKVDTELPKVDAPEVDTAVPQVEAPVPHIEEPVEESVEEPLEEQVEVTKQDPLALRNQTSTPDIAAEVADSAAILDQDPPTPPVSDEEAGRLGLRRMSQTPIPEVAKTAAEVADVAATLDEEEIVSITPAHIEFPGLEEDGSTSSPFDSTKSTPPNEKVPRFSHESVGLRPPHEEGPCTHEPLDPIPKPRPLTPGYEEAVDLNDPNIEAFPTTREEIIARLRRLSEHLPEDVTNVDIAPPSPVFDHQHIYAESGVSAITPLTIVQDETPILNIIAEEHDEPEIKSSFIPVTPTKTPTTEVLAKAAEPVKETPVEDEPVEPSTTDDVAVEETAVPEIDEVDEVPEVAFSNLELEEPSACDADAEIGEAISSVVPVGQAAEPTPSHVEEEPESAHVEPEISIALITIPILQHLGIVHETTPEPVSVAEVKALETIAPETLTAEVRPVEDDNEEPETIEEAPADVEDEYEGDEKELPVEQPEPVAIIETEAAEPEAITEEESTVDVAEHVTSTETPIELVDTTPEVAEHIEIVAATDDATESQLETKSTTDDILEVEETTPVATSAVQSEEASSEEGSEIEDVKPIVPVQVASSEPEEESSSEDESDMGEAGSVATSAQPELPDSKVEGEQTVFAKEPESLLTKEVPVFESAQESVVANHAFLELATATSEPVYESLTPVAKELEPPIASIEDESIEGSVTPAANDVEVLIEPATVATEAEEIEESAEPTPKEIEIVEEPELISTESKPVSQAKMVEEDEGISIPTEELSAPVIELTGDVLESQPAQEIVAEIAEIPETVDEPEKTEDLIEEELTEESASAPTLEAETPKEINEITQEETTGTEDSDLGVGEAVLVAAAAAGAIAIAAPQLTTDEPKETTHANAPTSPSPLKESVLAETPEIVVEDATTSREIDSALTEDLSVPVVVTEPSPETATENAAEYPTSEASPEWKKLRPIRKISTGNESPEIQIQPATPAPSVKNPLEAPIDTAKSSSVEEPDSQVTSRTLSKVKSATPDRPLTPNSLRSAGKEARDRNFLKAFWRAVFVDWIGGIVVKLCGGGRRGNTLMAMGAIAAVALAPALYFFR